MTSFLLLLSFFIHLVLFIIIFRLYEQVKYLKEKETNYMKDTLATFLAEIRKENQMLELKLSQQNNEKYVTNNIDTNKLPEHTTHNMNGRTSWIERMGRTNNTDIVNTSVESRILQMNIEGKSVEQIARELNKGKT